MLEWYWQGKTEVLWEKRFTVSVVDEWMNEYGAMTKWYWQGKIEVLGEKHYIAWMVDEWISMEKWWNDDNRRKKEVRGGKPVSMLLYPPQIPLRLAWDRTRISAVTGRRLTAWERFTQMWQVCLCGISHNHLCWFEPPGTLWATPGLLRDSFTFTLLMLVY
jgi:hypothetical protein